jgi:DDE superfamily endonuclease
MTLHFLKCYPTELQLAGIFGINEKSARKWVRFYVKKIQALKAKKVCCQCFILFTQVVYTGTLEQLLTSFFPQITFPEHFLETDETRGWDCVMSVDGTHCEIQEPKHATLSKDPSYYSHKLNHAGLSYEVALSISEDRIVWVNGPFPAATSDITIFRNGLKHHIPHGKRCVADKGYRGEPNYISTPNIDDGELINWYKTRARSRQESINCKIKFFRCMAQEFRHSIEFHGCAFDAICVIVQYQLENGSTLFDIAV